MTRHDVVRFTRDSWNEAALNPEASWLVATLEVLTVIACLALGIAFVGSLTSHPDAPPDATTRACEAGSPTPC